MCGPLQWRHNGRDSVSNHQPHDCLLNRYSDADQRKHQSSASLAFVREIHQGPVNSPHKWPGTRKCFHLMTSSWRYIFKFIIRPLSSSITAAHALFLFGWPPCQRSDMTLVEVSQHAYNCLFIRTIVLFVFLRNSCEPDMVLVYFCWINSVWVWVWVVPVSIMLHTVHLMSNIQQTNL